MAGDKYENKDAGELRDILKSITGELTKHKTIHAESAAEYRKMDSIARQLQDTTMGISNLSSDELEKLKRKNESHIKELQYNAQRLASQKIGAKFEGEINESVIERLKFLGKLSTEEEAILKAASDNFKIEKDLTAEVERQFEKRKKYEKEVQALQGATGAAIKGLHGSMDKLGLSSLNNFLQVDKAKEAMEEEADAIARGEKAGGALQVRMAGIKTLAKGFAESMLSAEAVIGFIVKQLAAGSQNMADFRKQTGMSYESAYATNMEMKGIAAASGDNFITSEKLNKSYSMMTEQLGVSADILGGKALVSATNLSERLGMSAENASQLTMYSRLQGKDTETILSNATATVGAYNKQNKTAINAKQVMNDVAGASKSLYLNMGKNVGAMAATATKARALGLSLSQVEKISESMLNFEESIGNELQANLLLGGGVNLAKAREAALTGDTAKLTDEIGKQESIRNAFATKNVIAQDAAAKALGLSREELAGMALQQDLNNLSAEEFKKRYGETTYESMKSRSASEKLGDAMAKVTDILGSLVQVFSPFLDLLAWVLANPIAPWLIAGAVAAKVLSNSVSGIGKAFGSMYNFGKQALSSLAGLFKKGGLSSALGGLKDKLTGGFKSAGADKAKDVASDKAGGLAEDAKGKVAGKEGGTGFKDSMKNLAGGLKAMGAKGVLQGIVNLALAGPALILALPSIPFLLFMGKASLKELPANFTGLAEGLNAMTGTIAGSAALAFAGPALLLALPSIPFLLFMGKVGLDSLSTNFQSLSSGLQTMSGTFVGSAALAAFGIAGTLAIPSLIFLTGIAIIGAPAAAGLTALAGGLEALGGAMATGVGALGLAALIAGAIGLGFALNLAAPAIEAYGKVFTAVFAGLSTLVTSVAEGFVAIMGAVTMDNIGPMMLLGPALFGIAAGLTALSFAGIMAIPAIGGLVMLAAISPALVSLADAFGMGGESAGEAKGKADEGSMAAVEAKLTELIAIVKAGGDVYLDSNKVGRAQVLGSYKSS